MKIKYLQGLPGSGKSTFAREFVSKNKDWVIVNRDSLRNMRGEYWIPKQEDMITQMENACCNAAFSYGLNVILDATNFNEERNKERFKSFKNTFPLLEMETHKIDTPLEECIKNDLKRPNSVGEKVIRDMYNKYLAPKKVEYVEDEKLPHCIIFDVDGTLAKMNGRSPYEWKRVEEDTLNTPIVELCKRLYNTELHIIIFTGRDGCCLNETKGWLSNNNIHYTEIFIRPEGNTEKDSIIKKRMFEQHIRGKYYCEGWVDDRDQVVKMVREELGITCLQVAEGNF